MGQSTYSNPAEEAEAKEELKEVVEPKVELQENMEETETKNSEDSE